MFAYLCNGWDCKGGDSKDKRFRLPLSRNEEPCNEGSCDEGSRNAGIKV